MQKHPLLYEINTAVWLNRLAEKYRRPLTLKSIPDSEWKDLAQKGFDGIWLMGIWRRSPAARKLALIYFPEYAKEDIQASPYAIYDYSLDPMFGKPGDLIELKYKMNKHGLRLIVDFVPNHLALDHPWLEEHPDRLVGGTPAEAFQHPSLFFSQDKIHYFAHGKDPYFPAWTDTVQVNLFSTDLREAWTKQLEQMAVVADGVRCDMAMLVIHRIFEETWRPFLRGAKPPREEFWLSAIKRVKSQFPDFIFMAEAYWDLEWELQQMGFDFTHDKKFYDLLRHKVLSGMRGHLHAEADYQNRSVHFIENHDEERAVTAFGKKASLAAATFVATLPGLRFFHEGQLEGRTERLAVQFLRDPNPATDPFIEKFYSDLLTLLKDPIFHEGQWEFLKGEDTFFSWQWKKGARTVQIRINFSDHSLAEPHSLPPWGIQVNDSRHG